MTLATPVRRTGLVAHDRYFQHDARDDFGPWVEPGEALERPAARRRFLKLLHTSGLADVLVPVAPRPLTDAELLRVHTPRYLDHLARNDATGGEAGEYAGFGPGSYGIARLAAGGCVEAVRAVLSGAVDVAYALVRPPGHHAEADRGRGYCLLANVALAVHAARADFGARRVAVVDWDVHHGNGTEEAFYGDADVLTISLHQDRHYPEDSGGVDDAGTGAGLGANINIPLPPGCGRGAYLHAFDEIVLPALRRHRPDLIVVAAGYDASGVDPLGRMQLSSGAFAAFTDLLVGAAEDLCGGRFVLCQEGGYSALHVPFCGLRVVERLAGTRTAVEDPFDWIDDLPGHEVQPHQERAVAAARDAHHAAIARRAG